MTPEEIQKEIERDIKKDYVKKGGDRAGNFLGSNKAMIKGNYHFGDKKRVYTKKKEA